jgi:hypothetical protein
VKKIQVFGSKFVSTTKPTNSHVLLVREIAGALVLQYFSLLTDVEVSGCPTLDAVPDVDPTESADLRRMIHTLEVFPAELLSDDAALQGKFAVELGRHVFRPGVAPTVCGAGEVSSFSAFAFPFGQNDRLAEPYSVFTESQLDKGSVRRHATKRDAQVIAAVYSDNNSAALDGWTFVYVDSPPFVLVDKTSGTMETAASGFSLFSLLPIVELSTSSIQNGAAAVSVAVKRNGSIIDYTGELVVEPVAGYVPNTRVAINNGVGSFKVMPLGLEPGEAIRVKVGTKTLTGMADISIPVE